MTERSRERLEGNPWLERLAWNAAATAVLAVLILLLLASLEWLDRLSGIDSPPSRTASMPTGAVALGPPERPQRGGR